MTTPYDPMLKTYENPYPTPEPEPYHPEETVLPEPVDAPPPPERVHLETPEEAWAYAEQLAQEKLDEPQVQVAIAQVKAEPPSGRAKAMGYLEAQVEVSKAASTVRPR
jgi:hypothetical protein